MRRTLIEATPRPHAALESDTEVQVAEYLEMLRRHWRLLVVTAVLGAAAGLLHYFNTEPSYTARTRILIERRNPSPLQGDTTWFAPWWNPEFYPTQYEILRSQGVALFVVERLRLWEDPHLQSPHGGQSAADDEAYRLSLANRVRSGLEVKEVKGTQLVDLHYRTNNPELAQRIVNGYASAFIEYGKEERRRSASDASGFLSAEIESLKREIADKEAALQQYSRSVDLVSTESTSNPLQQRLDGINAQLVEARARRIEAEARYNEAVNGNREGLATGRSTVINEVRAELDRKEREYQTKLKTFKPDFPEMERLDADIAQTRSRLDTLIEENAQAAIDQARSELNTARSAQAALERELARVRSESIDMSSTAAQYTNLRGEITNQRNLLDELLKRQSETDVAVRGSDQATVRQIDVAGRPGSPSNPKLQRSLGRGTALGLGLGLAIALLFEFLDRTIKTAEELERRLGLPVLAVIPDVSSGSTRGGVYGQFYGRVRRHGNRTSAAPRRAAKKGESIDIDLVPHARPKLAVSEAYRSLRTALLLSSAEELKTVVVTSATAGEGKTATSCNLAVVLAQLGKRVLLIDADTRKPRVHQVFRTSNRVGLVNFLVGRNELHEALIQSPVPSLFLCPAGPTPPNPSELISSERMRYLLREAAKQFDIVVIDSPPTLAVTDATLLGSMTDGVVVCVRAATISRDEVRICRDRLALAGVRILGGVLNAHQPLTGSYYKGYTYHYESYGDAGKNGTSESAVA